MKFLFFTLNIIFFQIFLSGCPSTTEIFVPDTTESGTVVTDTIMIPDAGDTTPDVIDSDTDQPSLCKDNEACNYLFYNSNYCTGSCIYQEHALSCSGNKINSLCYMFDLPAKPETKDIIDGIKIVAQKIPENIIVGDRLELKLILTNTEKTEKTLRINYKNTIEWEIFPQNFSNDTTLFFKPEETKELIFNANAIQANVFLIAYKPIISFNFNDSLYELYADVYFDWRKDYILCNNHYFPPNYCETDDCSTYNRYSSSVCCDNIFYPASQCCIDSDCNNNSVCIDGMCIFRTPAISLANTTLIQNNRILIILSDIDSDKKENLCENKVDQYKDILQLDIITDYYKKIIFNRTRRSDVLQFKFELLAGFKSEDFIEDRDYTFANYKKSLQKYLDTLGCKIDFTDYDKIIIMSPRMDLYGFGGMAFGNGDIGQTIYSNGYLTAHELAHSFGATDLYLELGGRFQYAFTLMASNFSWGIPEDRVTWGELGLADINRNGVIDLFEFARFPEEIVVEDIRAQITRKETVEIGYKLYLLEGGIKKKGIFLSSTIELPEYNVLQELYNDDTYYSFDKYQVDLDKIREKGSIDIRIRANYKYSDRDFNKRVLSFDKTFTVPVSIQE